MVVIRKNVNTINSPYKLPKNALKLKQYLYKTIYLSYY